MLGLLTLKVGRSTNTRPIFSCVGVSTVMLELDQLVGEGFGIYSAVAVW